MNDRSYCSGSAAPSATSGTTRLPSTSNTNISNEIPSLSSVSSPNHHHHQHLHHHRGNTPTKFDIGSTATFYDPIRQFDYNTLPIRPPALGEERSAAASASYLAETASSMSTLSRGANMSGGNNSRTTVHHYHHHHHQPLLDKEELEVEEEEEQRQRALYHHHHHHKFGRGAPPPQQQQLMYKPSPTSSTISPLPIVAQCETEDERSQCLQWAHSLHKLLQDPYGVKLFLRYLESEGPRHAEALHFWFACEGLKNHDDVDKIQRLVKLIYKKYFMKSALPINDELRKQIVKRMKSPQSLFPPVTLFDEAQSQVETLINNSTYPNFLKSDIYLEYLQSVSSGQRDYYSDPLSPGSPVGSRDLSNLSGAVGQLPTLHEDLEFNPQPSTHYTPGCHTPTVRLTQEMLLISQQHRALDIRPKSETYAGLIYRGNKGGHAAYNSYNPVSRQDSEMQSLSSHSDARTESDSTSVRDELREGSSRRHRSSTSSQLAFKNKETDMDQPFIPRTQRLDSVPSLNVKQHAALLMEKLTRLKRRRDADEKIQRQLQEGDFLDETTINSKLQFHAHDLVDNDQDILDEHVSRVFSDCSLPLTPDASASPRPSHSPTLTPHSAVLSAAAAAQPMQRCGQQPQPRRHHRADKDGMSTFSGDSGNVHDFADFAALPKSKSMPQQIMLQQQQRRSSSSTSSKKTLTELTDSGVSVISDPASGASIRGVRDWLRGQDCGLGSGFAATMSEMAVREPFGVVAAGRKSKRSSSLERNCSVKEPQQPFVADPCMPPPPFPNIDIQLDEIRRRLVQEDRARIRSSAKHHNNPGDFNPAGSQSTLGHQSKTVTGIVISFGDGQLPWLIKVPGVRVTLRQLKEMLPRKGNYRYFFRTVCPELNNQVTNEELSNDSDVLPLWQGKIMAEVKQID